MIQRLKVSIRPHDGGSYIFFYFILISFNLRTNETAYGKLTSCSRSHLPPTGFRDVFLHFSNLKWFICRSSIWLALTTASSTAEITGFVCQDATTSSCVAVRHLTAATRAQVSCHSASRSHQTMPVTAFRSINWQVSAYYRWCKKWFK